MVKSLKEVRKGKKQNKTIQVLNAKVKQINMEDRIKTRFCKHLSHFIDQLCVSSLTCFISNICSSNFTHSVFLPFAKMTTTLLKQIMSVSDLTVIKS